MNVKWQATVAALVAIGALFIPTSRADEEAGFMKTQSLRVVSQHKAVFTAPPAHVPSDTAVDAPLLGNGDFAVCIGGPPEAQKYYLSKNDFWRLKHGYGESTPKPLGILTVSCPALTGAAYLVEQDLATAVTRSQFRGEKCTLTVLSWVDATTNALHVGLSLEGEPLEIALALRPAMIPGAQAAEYPLERAFVSSFADDVDIPVAAACAMALKGAETTSFQLESGASVGCTVAAASSFDAANPLQAAKSLARDALQMSRSPHEAWWADFWARSFVELDAPDIERHYYLSNYVMASCSRDPEFPPPIFGTWITTPNPAWHGDYHLNYNHMAPYYGLYSSNHIEQADPYHAPILDFMERGRWYAREALGIRGVYYPVGIGPKGIETTRNSPHEKDNEKGGLFFGQKSNAAYCVVNMSMRWYRTYDLDYARNVYPFVREVADFWENYLTFEDGRYVVHDDAVHEGSGRNINSIVTLGLVMNVLETAIDMSLALGIDTKRHEKWHHILAHLSGFATQERDGKTVFRYTELGTAWWKDNTLGIQHIYPAGAIGLDSAPRILETARNTINVMNRWVDFNGMNSFFPAAVRVGCDPNIILQKLGEYVNLHANPNGFAKGNPHGIENCSIVPNTINEMLCMGHGGVLRFFPVWPKDRPARFVGLRAEGAFLCSAALIDGQVQYARIVSERGRPCSLVNPWPGKDVILFRNGQKAETVRGDRFTFPTSPGERLELCPDGSDLEHMRAIGLKDGPFADCCRRFASALTPRAARSRSGGCSVRQPWRGD